MIKILFSYLAYPFAIASYFRRALERRNDVELFTVGSFWGQDIPWNGGMKISNKYMNQVDLPLPRGMNYIPWNMIKDRPPWKPDLSITVDADWHFTTKPDVPHAHVATDPHVLNYDLPRGYADWFFNMQKSYSKPNDVYLPYAFDPKCHYPFSHLMPTGYTGKYEKEYDCSIIGLHYPQRNELVTRLRELGIKVNYAIGQIFDEYREENTKAFIGLNWSSLNDVTARVFEIMAMRMVPVINRLPDLDLLGFRDGEHYLGFSNMDEAIKKVLWAKSNPDQAQQIADVAYQYVWNQNMTYDARIETILKTVGLL